jgi:hypothetical protein
MDWIDAYVESTTILRAPEAFRLWSAIGTIAAVLERRVWSTTDHGALFPNLYGLLCGTPGSGKTTMVREAHTYLSQINGLHLGPDNPTKASFLHALEGAIRTTASGAVFSAMTVLPREFGVLIPRNDPQFLEDLSDIWESPPRYHAPRVVSKSVTVENPTVNILAAATPDTIGVILPESSWGQGFTSRLLFIYGVRNPQADRNIFEKRPVASNGSALLHHLRPMFFELHGEFEWEEDAMLAANEWINSGMPPAPTYSRLAHYNSRRDMHLLKLSMISAISAGRNLRIALADVNRARTWLLNAEKTMPDVFRAMVMKSDTQLLDDLHYHVYSIYARVPRKERKPVPDAELCRFLANKIPADRVRKIIEMAEATGRVKQGVVPGEWIPQSLDKVGGRE